MYQWPQYCKGEANDGLSRYSMKFALFVHAKQKSESYKCKNIQRATEAIITLGLAMHSFFGLSLGHYWLLLLGFDHFHSLGIILCFEVSKGHGAATGFVSELSGGIIGHAHIGRCGSGRGCRCCAWCGWCLRGHVFESVVDGGGGTQNCGQVNDDIDSSVCRCTAGGGACWCCRGEGTDSGEERCQEQGCKLHGC